MKDDKNIEALSRRIAEKMEPEPEVTEDLIARDHGLEYGHLFSPLDWWVFESHWTVMGQQFDSSWQPRSILESEVSMRLLKWLLGQNLIVSIDFTAGNYEVACDPMRGRGSFVDVGLPLELAIARAAAKAMGVKQ